MLRGLVSPVKEVQKIIDLETKCVDAQGDAYFSDTRHSDDSASLFRSADDACEKSRIALRNLEQEYEQLREKESPDTAGSS